MIAEKCIVKYINGVQISNLVALMFCFKVHSSSQFIVIHKRFASIPLPFNLAQQPLSVLHLPMMGLAF